MHLLSTISSLCQKPVPTRRALCLESHGLPMLGLFRVVPSSGCPCTRYPPASRSRRTSVVRLWTSVFSLFPSDLDSKGTTNIQVKFPGGWAPGHESNLSSSHLSSAQTSPRGAPCSKFPSGFGIPKFVSLLDPLCKVDLNWFTCDVVGRALVRHSASSPASVPLPGVGVQ